MGDSEAEIKRQRADLLIEDHADCVAEVSRLRAERDRLQDVGRALATCAFNMKQRDHLTEAERRSLSESQEEWDAAIDANRTAREEGVCATCGGRGYVDHGDGDDMRCHCNPARLRVPARGEAERDRLRATVVKDPRVNRCRCGREGCPGIHSMRGGTL